MYKQNWGLNPWWLEPTWATKSDWGIAQRYWGPSHVVFSGPSSKWCSINAFPDTRGRFCADSLTNGLGISQHESPLPNQFPDVPLKNRMGFGPSFTSSFSRCSTMSILSHKALSLSFSSNFRFLSSFARSNHRNCAHPLCWANTYCTNVRCWVVMLSRQGVVGTIVLSGQLLLLLLLCQ